MNKRMCASIISLHRLKPCTRNDFHRRFLFPSASSFSWSPVCTSMHTNIRQRWLLLFVVVQYELKELQIKFPSEVNEAISCNFFNKVNLSSDHFN